MRRTAVHVRRGRTGCKMPMLRVTEKLRSRRLDTRPLVAHRSGLGRIEEGHKLFANQQDGEPEVAITP